MTTLAALANCVITDTGRTIAARVALMVERGLPIDDALAVAAELGMEHARVEAEGFRKRAKYGELPK